jgi:hypothetical protein
LYRIPPVSGSLGRSKVDSKITVALYNEDGDYPQPPEFAFAAAQYDDWNSSWFGIALDSFDADFEVDVDLSGTAEGELTLSLMTKSAQYGGVAVEVDFQLYLMASASAAMTFTTGLNLAVSRWS